MKLIYKYKNFISLYNYNIKINKKKINNFHKIKLSDASILIIKNIKKKKYLFLNEFRAAFKKKMIGLPGGFVERNENPIKCAKREASEELGIQLENLKFLTKFVRNSNYHCGIDHVYYAETNKDFIKTEKNVTFEWLSAKKVIDLLKKNSFQNPGFYSAISYYFLNK